MTRIAAAVLSLCLCNVALAQETRPVLPAAQRERDDAVRKASLAYADAVKAANAKYVAALKAELAETMKKGNLDRANQLNQEIKSVGDAPAPSASSTFDFRKAIRVARYYSDVKSFEISDEIAKLATEHKVQIPKKLWSVVRKDPKPNGPPKYFQLTFDCGPYVVDINTELPDEISPVVTVTPKAK